MKYRKICLIIVTCVLFSIQNFGKNQHKTTNNGIKEILIINGRTIDWRKFQKVYYYITPEGDEKQILGVDFLNKDSIGYQLFRSSDECSMEIHGFAKNRSFQGTMFDKDRNEKLSIDEYINNLENISIKIESKSKSKAKFIYKPKNKDEECDPNNDIIMETKNDTVNLP